MIRIGVPSKPENYYYTDGNIAYQIHQQGCIPEWRDGECLYFRKSKKLFKILNRLGIDMES